MILKFKYFFFLYSDSYSIEDYSAPNSLQAYSFCLNEQLASNCVEFNDIGMATGCYGYIKYRKSCPDAKPATRI
jgi:hypothetical protein